jgi:predicted GH43/DUF377 family glycosyl hydrolase
MLVCVVQANGYTAEMVILDRRQFLSATLGSSLGFGTARIGAAQSATEPRLLPGGPGKLFGPGPAGWWDSERVSCPRVLRDPAGGWLMWYYGRDPEFDREVTLPTGRVGLATSADGIHWQRVRGPLAQGAVFGPDADQSRFDSAHVGISDVHRRNDLYWMWYLGGDGRGRRRGFPLRPGCAVSRDGQPWYRVSGPYRGALLDAGAEGEFDEFMVGWPQVIQWDDGNWRMYYHTVQLGKGYFLAWAESPDGFRWQKRGPIMGPGPKGRFDDYGVATRHMVKLDDTWTMFYEGCHFIGDPIQVDRQIGVATSVDGINWQRVDGPHADGAVIAQAPKGSGLWDHRLGCPWLVPMPGGGLRLYYIGSNERPESGGGELDAVHQIGLAVSSGAITEWERYRG